MAIFTGTDANDSYLSTSAGDNARGLRGDDTLIGGAGRDTLNGNADNDLLRADSSTQTAGGNDSLFGGQGSDTLLGAQFGFSADSLGGNRGQDLLIASTNGGNTLFGGQGDDTIYGSLSNGNTMNGDLGSDVLVAGRGNDRMLGADGNDTLIGGGGNNDMFGETGNDQFQFFTAIDGDISVLTGAEQVIRSRGGFGGSDVINDFSTGDTISISQLDRNATVRVTTNDAGAAVIAITGTASDGQPTNNQTITVVGVTRDALLAPGAQLFAINGSFITTNDTVNDGAGGSVFTVGNGAPGGNIRGLSLVGSETANTFTDDPAAATPAGGINLVTTVNDDTLAGLGGNDFMFGSAGNDSINGGDSETGVIVSGANILVGTAPFLPAPAAAPYAPVVLGDTLIGGIGIDTLTGGGGSDAFRFITAPGEVDTITDFFPNQGDIFEISAAAFGGSLVAGAFGLATGVAPTSFSVVVGAGGPPANGTQAFGVSEFYYNSNNGDFFYDANGTGTGGYVQFARLANAPAALTAVANLFGHIKIIA
jgi:Ca2+-binding RTX toxin-like protein